MNFGSAAEPRMARLESLLLASQGEAFVAQDSVSRVEPAQRYDFSFRLSIAATKAYHAFHAEVGLHPGEALFHDDPPVYRDEFAQRLGHFHFVLTPYLLATVGYALQRRTCGPYPLRYLHFQTPEDLRSFMASPYAPQCHWIKQPSRHPLDLSLSADLYLETRFSKEYRPHDHFRAIIESKEFHHSDRHEFKAHKVNATYKIIKA